MGRWTRGRRLRQAWLPPLVMGSALAALGCGSDPVAPDPGTQSQIVFQAEPEQDNSEIYTVNADGTGLRRLTTHPDPDFAPSWSADGSQIYFSSRGRDEGIETSLYAMDPDGSNVHLLLAHPPGALHTWSPEGDRIAYALARPGGHFTNGGQWELYVAQADGSGPTRLYESTSFCDDVIGYNGCTNVVSIAWAPVGGQLAFSTRRTGRAFAEDLYLYTINDDGTGGRVLRVEAPFGPSWSPDGGRIAVSSGHSIGPGGDPYQQPPQSSDIVVIDLGSEQASTIVNGGLNTTDVNPSWSPDGESIAFSRGQLAPVGVLDLGLSQKIFVVGADGSGLRLVADVPGARAPKWRPRAP